MSTHGPPPVSQGSAIPWKPIAIGCAIIGLLGVMVLCCAGVLILRVNETSQSIDVQMAVPAEMALGAEADLVITVTNVSSENVTIGDVDVSDAYMSGFTVVSTDPQPKSRKQVPIVGAQSFTHEITLPPKGSQVFTIRLRAQSAGVHRGDVDVWIGMGVVTNLAETVVR